MAGFERRTVRLAPWRAVEAQHVISTMLLVDTEPEQRLLEELLEASKPPVPAADPSLHYLLFTPFRYPPIGRGSRFRRTIDPGVFYGADERRTACAELGYWRWRFLMASPAVGRLDPMPQTVFQVAVRGPAIDLRRGELARDRERWTHPSDYSATQALGAAARAAGVAIIRYQSVRDPDHGGAAALLTPAVFTQPAPLAEEPWILGVTRERVRWIPGGPVSREPGFDFPASIWAVA